MRMNFYAVKPGFFYAQRGFGKLFCNGVHVVRGHFAHGLFAFACILRLCRDARTDCRIAGDFLHCRAARVVDLRDDAGVVFMDGLHKLCKARNIGVARNGELALVRLALGANVSVFGDDESDAAAFGARVVVCEQVVLHGTVRCFAGCHRRHDKAICEFHIMDGERGVQQFVHGENSFPFGF